MQLFQHIAVAHLGAHQLHALVFQRFLDCHVGHQRAHHAGDGLPLCQSVSRHDVEQFIAIEQSPLGIHHLQAVGIAIKRNAVVRAMRSHCGLQRLRVRGPHPFVDVEAVGRTPDGDHLGAQFMEHVRGHLVGRTVSGIDHQLQAFERQVRCKGALAELDVTAAGILQTAGAPQAGRIHPAWFLQQRGLDRQFPAVRQLLAVGRKELDAVVCKRIVRGTDDHAQTQPQGPGQVGHAGGGQGTGQHHIHARRRKTGLQGGFQHVARNAGVLADQHRGA